MPGIKTAWDALRSIGLRTVAAAAAYGVRRKRLDARYPGPALPEFPLAEEEWAGPGEAGEVRPSARGLEARFPGADLGLSFLAADLVEVTWREPSPRPPLPRREWPVVPVAFAGDDPPSGLWRLSSDALTVTLSRSGEIRFFSREAAPGGDQPGGGWSGSDRAGGGQPGAVLLRRDFPPLFARNGPAVRHRAALAPAERLYGLGERAAPLDLRGGRYRMWNTDPSGYGPGADPLYLSIPVYASQGVGSGYLVFYANSWDAAFDLGRADPDASDHVFAGGGLRYYFIPGPLDRALERYTDLTGKPPLPPLWALGYQQSRWSYFPESRVRRLAADFKAHDIPVDAIHLDIHYMDGYRVFTVDPKRFPNLGRLAGDLKRDGIRLVTVIDPGVKQDPGFALYREGVEQGLFVREPDHVPAPPGCAAREPDPPPGTREPGATLTGRPAIAPVWPGPCAFPDFTSARTREWWGRQYRALLDQGVAGFWHDMNEPAAFVGSGDPTLPLCAQHELGEHRAVHNLYGLFENQAAYEGLRLLDPTHRPFIVSRSGWAGVQRHAWTWNADVRSDWECLRMTVTTAIGAGLCGVAFFGSDIGGFTGTPSPDLYLRWLEVAAFMPFFRGHTMIGTPDQEPWSFGEPYTSAARDIIRLRYALLPYIYTVAWQASRHGWPVVRPVFWPGAAWAGSGGAFGQLPGSEGLLDVAEAFFVGPDLLVVPRLEPEEGRRASGGDRTKSPGGDRTKSPGGDRTKPPALPGRWYRLGSDLAVDGRDVWDRGRGASPPCFVRAGSVLPMVRPPSGTMALSRERLELHVYLPPEDGESSSVLYSDDGDGYEAGRVDRFIVNRDGPRVFLTWSQGAAPGASPRDGSTGLPASGEVYPWPYREVRVFLHGSAVSGATVDGVPVEPSGARSVGATRFQRLELVLGD